MTHGRIGFHPRALAAATVLFAVEVCIATVFRPVLWVRGFAGDAIAVVLVYYIFKTFVRAPPLRLAVAALFTGYALELAQAAAHFARFHVENRILRIVVGATPDWWDVLAYTVGFVAVLLLERVARRP
jgi:hypothetical protein